MTATFQFKNDEKGLKTITPPCSLKRNKNVHQ
jgi:hypothetical protein